MTDIWKLLLKLYQNQKQAADGLSLTHLSPSTRIFFYLNYLGRCHLIVSLSLPTLPPPAACLCPAKEE